MTGDRHVESTEVGITPTGTGQATGRRGAVGLMGAAALALLATQNLSDDTEGKNKKNRVSAEKKGKKGPQGPQGPQGPAGGGTGPAGPAGPAGPSGTAQIAFGQIQQANVQDGLGFAEAESLCPNNFVAISGHVFVEETTPAAAVICAMQASGLNQNNDGWIGRAACIGTDGTLTVQAICVPG